MAREPILERARSNAARGLYFDVLEFEKNLETSQTPNTPAISLMYAAAAQMEAIIEEGIERRWARHRAMADRTYAWIDEMRGDGIELGVLAAAGYRSPTVTCVTLPDGLDATDVCATLRARGYVVAPGYGKTRHDMFRIGHMGDHTLDELDALLDRLAEVLKETVVNSG